MAGGIFGSIILLIFGLFLILIGLGLLGFFYWGLWKLFTKAGQDGWKAIIPYYKDWVLMKDICGLHWGWFVANLGCTLLTYFLSFIQNIVELSFINNNVSFIFSIIGWIFTIVAVFIQVAWTYNLAKKFNKSTGWIVLTMFFGFITIPLLGFVNKEEYQNVKVSQVSLYSVLFEKK